MQKTLKITITEGLKDAGGRPAVSFEAEGLKGYIVLQEELDNGTFSKEQITQMLADQQEEKERQAKRDFLIPVKYSPTIH